MVSESALNWPSVLVLLSTHSCSWILGGLSPNYLGREGTEGERAQRCLPRTRSELWREFSQRGETPHWAWAAYGWKESEVAQLYPTLCNPMARRNINNLRYAEDTTLVAESEEELRSLLMKVKEERKICLKTQHSENEDHGIWSHHFMGNSWGNNGNSDRLYFGGLQNHCKW